MDQLRIQTLLAAALPSGGAILKIRRKDAGWTVVVSALENGTYTATAPTIEHAIAELEAEIFPK